MMTLHKLHAGDGYTYLTRQVAAGDEGRSPGQKLVDYYTASGNPPGRWIGAGAADLAVEGRVREDQMRALFGKGMHPDAEQIIALELAAGRTQAEAMRAAKLGRAFPAYTPLPPRAERVNDRITGFTDEHGRPPTSSERSRIEAEEARRERRAVAGYDLVFTPVKSVSLLWALGSAATREQVEAAHHDAVADTLAWLERETAFARIGDKGEAQIETRGFLAAAFDHRDSRAGDPDLHTHVAISNKVRARDDHPDGRPRWLSLDARVIHAAAVAASERYNTRVEEALTRRLGVEFTDRAETVRRDKRSVREIAGMPVVLIKHFSRRRAAIEDRYRELAADYRQTHGHEPPREAQLKLAQQATLETRDHKAAPTSLAEKITAWRDEAATVLGANQLADLEHDVLHRDVATTTLADLPVDEIARTVRRGRVGGEGHLDEVEPHRRDRTPAARTPVRHERRPRRRDERGRLLRHRNRPLGPAHPRRRPGPDRRAGADSRYAAAPIQRGERVHRARSRPVHHSRHPRRRATPPRHSDPAHPLRTHPRFGHRARRQPSSSATT